MSDPHNRTSLRPQFTSQFSYGNIITIAIGLIGFAVAWGEVKSRIAGVEDGVISNKAEITRVSAQTRENELSITRQDERTNSILTGIARIEGQLVAIDKRLNSRAGN